MGTHQRHLTGLSEATPVATRRAAILLAKSAITGAATRQMQMLARRVADSGQVECAVFAFSEQGTPSLREAHAALADRGVDEVLLLPLLLPMEPGFTAWIERSVQRWQAARPQRRWPSVRVAAGTLGLSDAVLSDMLDAAASAPPLAPGKTLPPAASLVPAPQWRVLVCQGAPCNNAGAAVVWGHLRNEQKRLNLRTAGADVMTCKTSCLGPCALAPVLQVFPGGTFYGGIDEAGIDRIVAGHLQGGRVVEALAYAPGAAKQQLRSIAASPP